MVDGGIAFLEENSLTKAVWKELVRLQLRMHLCILAWKSNILL